MGKYKTTVDRKNATFRLDEPEDLTDDEVMALVKTCLLSDLEITGEDKLKALVPEKKLRDKFAVVMTVNQRAKEKLYNDDEDY